MPFHCAIRESLAGKSGNIRLDHGAALESRARDTQPMLRQNGVRVQRAARCGCANCAPGVGLKGGKGRVQRLEVAALASRRRNNLERTDRAIPWQKRGAASIGQLRCAPFPLLSSRNGIGDLDVIRIRLVDWLQECLDVLAPLVSLILVPSPTFLRGQCLAATECH